MLQLHHFSIVPELKMQNSRNIARSISLTTIVVVVVVVVYNLYN
jgi:hypothetical protein